MLFIKRFLTTISILIIISVFTTDVRAGFGLDSNTSCKSAFVDVGSDSLVCQWTNYLYYNKVVNGFSDLTYRENQDVTRGEFAKFIVSAFYINTEVEYLSEESFGDVSPNHPFFKYINALKYAGIVNGYEDGTYRPESFVTRATAYKFIVNAARYKNQNLFAVEEFETYDDVNSTNKFYTYINRAYKVSKDNNYPNQIISTIDENNFKPDDNLKRGDLARIMANTIIYGGLEEDIEGTRNLGGIGASRKIYDSGYRVYHYDGLAITIVLTSSDFKYDYIPNNTPTISTLAQNINYKFMVNGGFFGGTHLNADHAGFLNYYGLHLTPLKGPDMSMQLTHVVRYNNGDSSISILDRNGFQGTVNNNQIVEFQTGPLVIFNNEIQQVHIDGSNNGNTEHTRTLIGTFADDTTEKFFIVVRSQMTLNELSRLLLNLDIFQGRDIHVINLDGGSSVAFYSRNYPELNYGTDKRLPIILGLK